MPPKNKGKKGKKGDDDDDFWAEKEKALEAKLAAEDAEAVDAGEAPEDDDDGGGLMAAIAAAKNKKKDKKKKKNAFVALSDDEEAADDKEAPRADMDDEWPEEDVKPKKGKKGKKAPKAEEAEEDDAVDDFEDKAAPKANLDDEWPEDDVKPKKGKKGKKGKKVVEEEDDDDFLEKAAAEAAAAKAAAAEAEKAKAPEPAQEPEEEDDEEEGGVKILSKKEKEKLKKEKEKAKKKAQAAKKKAAAEETPEVEAAAETAAEPTPAPNADDDEGDEEETAGAASKNKKKKKKPAAKAEAAAPAPKKVNAKIAAMQAAMAESKRLQEEAAAAEAERLRRIEEEERRLEEEAAAEEARKEAKREKERLKKAQAKAEGRLLTPAQKRERAAAEARKQALLASGVKVAALSGDGPSAPRGKRPVYNNKKKGPAKPATPTASGTATPAEQPEPVKEEAKAEASKEESEDDWDKSEDEVEAVVTGVKDLKVESEDDWDKSDEEEPAPQPKAAPAPAAKGKAAPKPADKPAPKPAANPTANGKKPAAQVEESEEEESDEEESDEEDSDESDDTDDDSDSEDESEDEIEMAKERARTAIEARRKAAQAAQTSTDLRSPICCILGHVDTGKTKLLDKIRQTSVQEGEAGGITQQIGATFFPKEALVEKTEAVNKNGEVQVDIPGLLIIDTPGHESFSNLRSRGSSLCNIAILVIDITHGLEPQTIESLNLLKRGKTPFIVALNKIDKLAGNEWKTNPDAGFRDTLNAQTPRMQRMFADRVEHVKMLLMEQGLNSELYDENKNPGRTVSLVPTSAVTGEGVPDLLALLVKLTQERMTGSLMYLSEAEATILEVKVIEGLGTTIDIVLVNGVLREGDKIVLCGMNGPIVTNVRALLTPQPMRELRIKSAYVHHKEVKAALGVKISAPGLEKAIAGARMYVAQNSDEEEYYKDLAMDDLTSLDRYVQKSGRGVYVQASTLGSLEALLVFLKDMNIPVFEFGLGPVHKSAVIRTGLMLDRAPEYAVMLCFDVPVTFEAEEQAKKEGVKIFSAMIIYHLFDAFKKHMEEVKKAKEKEAAPMAVWPVRLKIIKSFASKDPIIVGCDIIEGDAARVGTPIGVVRYDKEKGTREIITLGKITGLEVNHKPMQITKKSQVGAGVAVKIERAAHQAARSFGRHFDEKDELVSLISRQSLDVLKSTFRDQVSMTDWALLKKLKTEQGVM